MTRLDSRASLSCHEYLHKQNAPHLFDLSKRQKDDPLVEALKKAGGEHEALVIRFLKTLNIPFLQIDLSQKVEAIELATLAALENSEVSMIFGASLGYHLEEAKFGKSISDRTSRPDVLFKTGLNQTGKPLWVPVDIKSHEAIAENKSNTLRVTELPSYNVTDSQTITGRLLEKDALQLAHYVAHLRELGFSDQSHYAGIIGKNYQSIVWTDLTQAIYGTGVNTQTAFAKYLVQFELAKEIITQSIIRAQNPANPPVSIAKRISGDFGCATCEFKSVCRDEMEAFDGGNGHVTLLSEVTAAKAEENFPDIDGIKDLATQTNLSPFGMKAVIRAQTWMDRKVRLINPSEPLNLPVFDIEMDIDLENSQAALMESGIEDIPGRDSIYLYGFGIHDRLKNLSWESAEFGYYDNYSDSSESELIILQFMWDRIKTEINKAESQGKSIGVFHYSQHEISWWRKFAERYSNVPGVPSLKEVEALISKYFIDLLKYTRKLAFPVTGYSIKTLAPLAGFYWSTDDAGGGNSLIKYQQAISESSDEALKDESINWLRAYNQDDVKATFAVRNYIRNLDL
jgi:predicted RecB family nuclease